MDATLATYDACSQWLESFRAEATKRKYVTTFNTFCKFHQITPDAILKKTPTELKSMIINYVIHLKKVAKKTACKPKTGEISVNSVPQYTNGIRSFLDFHEIIIPWKTVARFYPEQVTSELVPPTDEEVKKLLSVADIWDRVLIYLEHSSGVRRGVLANPMPMRFKHIAKLPSGVGAGWIYAESKEHRKPIRITPETMTAIEELKAWRQAQGEKITPDSLIMRDKYAALSHLTNKPAAINPGALTDRMVQLYKKAGIDRSKIQPNHGFRHLFSTKVRSAGVDKDVKRLLMGQSSDLDDIYDNVDDPKYQDMLTAEYLKAVDALTINDEHRLKKKVEVLEEQKLGWEKAYHEAMSVKDELMRKGLL
jgi:integrase